MSKPNPKELFYTKEHEWVKINQDTAILGVTDHAQELLTDLVFVELPKIGQEIKQDKSFAIVESVKSVSDVYAPISGKIIEINQALNDEPGLINQDAFNKGWIAKIKISNKKELDKLMNSKKYTEYCKKEEH
ncbi:MAG: glycine cleavage system protein GcvH [Patescibacteria group bacterium]|nr:glycine cleavage system protein GcvH [Patescibacteria group bacterium]